MVVNRRLKKKNELEAPYMLPRLAQKANKYHGKVTKHWLGLAENARKSGEALVKARYYRLWKRGTWKKWLQDNFDGSYETAKVYIKIAKKWNDPILEEARKKGVNLKSINKILQLLSGKILPDGTLNREKSKLDICTDHIRKIFVEKVRTELSKDELFVMVREDVFDCLWQKMHPMIRSTVCEILEHDPYEFEENKKFYDRWREDQRSEEEIRSRTLKALNNEN